MGHMIEEIALKRGHDIVCIIDKDNTGDFGSEAFRSAEVAIEFTTPDTARENCLRAWQQGVKVVSGSTGWMERHGEEMRRLCAEEGHTLFWASNFSLGVAVFSAVNRYLARIMNRFPAYDVTMEETHHIHKLDAPSGTAITLAEQIVAEMDRKTGWTKGELHAADGTISGTRHTPAGLLRIDAIRRDEVPGILKRTVKPGNVRDGFGLTGSIGTRAKPTSARQTKVTMRVKGERRCIIKN